MKFESMSIQGAWVGVNQIHKDSRGYFREWFKFHEIEEQTGIKFNAQQANVSKSKYGVLRGIHFSLSEFGQAKLVTCVSGSVWDVVVDIRPNSPTFGCWEFVELTEHNGKSVLISTGLGHAFVSLAEDSLLSYLQTSPYAPEHEYGINPLDTEIGIQWPIENLLMTLKDSTAPTMSELLAKGKLPR